MADYEVASLLAALDRSLAPPADVSERIWSNAVAALTGEAEAAAPIVRPLTLGDGHRRPRRTRRQLLAAAALIVVVAIVGGLLARGDRGEKRLLALGSGAQFRALVRTSAPGSTLAETEPRPTPAPRVPGAVIEPAERRIWHGGQGRWRVEWISGPGSVGGPGSYEVWNLERLLTYRADRNSYRIESLRGEEPRVPVISYVDVDRVERDCDRVERDQDGAVVAGRATRHLRCVREKTGREPEAQEDRWIDATTGLLLRYETLINGEVLARVEVVDIDYAPDLRAGTFSTSPPAGAREEKAAASPLGKVLSVGARAPDWEVARLGGGRLAWASLRGRPAVVLLWSSWCEPCVGETLTAFDAEAKARSTSLSLVTVAVNDKQADVAATVSTLGLTVPVGLDLHGQAVVRRWGPGAVPAYVFVHSDGSVAAVRLSPLPPGELAAALDALAAGRPIDIVSQPGPVPCDQPVRVEAGAGAPGVTGTVYFAVRYAKDAYGPCGVPVGPYAIRADGTSLERLSDDDDFRGVAVSPRGELVREVAGERRAVDESGELWLVRPSMRPRTKLVDRGSDPAWSNDGQRLAFVRRARGGRVTEVAVVNRDGKDVRTIATVTDPARVIRAPAAWAPGDSGLLVAEGASGSDEAADIVRYSLAGRRSPCLICKATAPAVSDHDGTVAFVHAEPASPGHGRIGLAQADGLGRRFLTPPPSATVPRFYELDFSPDGEWLVASGSVEASDPYPRRSLYLIQVASGQIVELANLGVRPTW